MEATNYSIRFKVNNIASKNPNYPDYVARRLDNYPLETVGVLNQYLFTYDNPSVRVTGETTPAFSDYRIIRGESNRDLISVIEFIEAQEKYQFSIQLKSNKNLKFRMWGQEIIVSESKNNAC